MSEQIKSIVERHIPAAYRGTREVQRAVDGIVRDLDAVRSNIARNVQAEGRRAGLSEAQVNEFLYSNGLADRPAPTPPPAAASRTTGADRDGLLERLVAFAEGHGFRG
jgi:hypothetical protein